MATGTVALNVTGNASQQLSKIKTQVDGLGKAFGSLRNALGGIAITGFIANTLRFADAISDVARATNVTTAAVLGFSSAVRQNGGSTEGAQNSLVKFVETIGEANTGSLDLQRAFSEVGVSLEDLRTLSEQDLLRKTISGLAQINDTAKRTKLQLDLLGKGFKGVDVQGVANDFDNAVNNSLAYAESVESAAKAQDNLETALENLRIAILDISQPLTEFLANISSSIETIKSVIKFILTLVAAFAAMTVVGRIGGAIVAILSRIGVAAEAVQAIALNLSLRFSQFGKVAQYVSDKIAAFGVWLSKISGSIPGLSTLVALITEGVSLLAGALAGAVTGWNLFGDSAEDNLKRTNEAIKRNLAVKERLIKKDQEQAQAVRDQVNAFDQQAREITKVTRDFKDKNSQMIAGINLEAKLIDMTERQADKERARIEIAQRAEETIKSLLDKKAAIKGNDDFATSFRQMIDAQIGQIRKLASTAQGQANKAIDNLHDQKNETELLVQDIMLLNKTLENDNALNQLQEQTKLIGLFGDELESATLLLRYEQDLQNKLLEIEQRRKNLQTENLDPKVLQSKLDALTAEEQMARDFANRKYLIEKDLAEKTKALRNDTALATKKYFDELARSVDPAVLTAQKWEAVFGGIDDAINQLVTTGKMNFKDFALSIIADLLRIQLRAIVVQALLAAIGAISGSAPTLGGGGGSGINTAGFAAKGAKPLAGQPFIVGEQGPELFVPKTAGTIVPNDKMGGQVNAPVTNVVNNYNISAVDAKSVAQLFAENRKSLLGAVGMAQKEMPYMMG